MDTNQTLIYEIMNNLSSCINISQQNQDHLLKILRVSYHQNKYSKPMPWIGMYMASASLVCVLAMGADLLHGFRNRKLWFPCKYFTINAAILTIIAVAMKLPVDLTSPMEGLVDQHAKIGSIAFMCTMMANFLPSLDTMDSMELLSNIIALGVLVITMVVNICIQISTGIIFNPIASIAIIYVAMLLMLLMIHTCSALTILKSKQILEFKYQTGHQTALRELESQQPERSTTEKLKQHVRNHWIMAGTGSPQFITACSATATASGVICAVSTLYPFYVSPMFVSGCEAGCDSDYQKSTFVLLIIQSVGILLGTIAPLCRCFAALSFKLSIKWIWNNIKVFAVESYWTQKLYDLKKSSIPFRVSNHKNKIVIRNLIILILSFCVGLQKTVVVACKMIALIPIFFVICVLFCTLSWKWIKSMVSDPVIVLGRTPEQLENNYVLKLQEDTEVAERTLKGITKSMNRLIEKAQKKQPNNLIKFLEESTRSFEGVRKYDSHQVQGLTAEEYLDSWSLPLVTLTAIAISLPGIQKDRVERLLSSVSKGLEYVTQVEESLNSTNEYVSSQKAAKWLWAELEVSHKWMENNLKNTNSQVNATRQILEWFRDTARDSTPVNPTVDENLIFKSICANSMYRITESILRSHQDSINKFTQQELFKELSSMIADILAACLTNLPQAIVMKCHTNLIEKREATVQAAAQLLGETMQIINSLQDREPTSLNPKELPFIVKWRGFLQHLIP